MNEHSELYDDANKFLRLLKNLLNRVLNRINYFLEVKSSALS